MLISLELVLLFITALAVGIIGNIAGIGGGVLIMAIFLFLFRINPVLAGGFSLITIITSAAGRIIVKPKAKCDKPQLLLFYSTVRWNRRGFRICCYLLCRSKVF